VALSPHRGILYQDFLIQKLGKEKFHQMRRLLESSSCPLKILNDEKERVAKIIGQNNMHYVRIFECLTPKYFLKKPRFAPSLSLDSCHLRKKKPALLLLSYNPS